jgi:PAS domain S-box-containing protein
MSLPPSATILNVNDEDPSRYLITHALTRAGFRVVEATTGAEALARLADGPDLIVLDVHLPDLSGFEVCQQIRANPAAAEVPIVHLSAHFTQPEDRVEGLESGADTYLVQPVEPRELLAIVRALLRARRAREEARATARQWQVTFDAIRDGVCVLDLSGRVLRCNRAMAEQLGRPAEAMVGRPYRDLLPPGLAPLADVCGRLAVLHDREVLEHPSGARWLRATTDPIRDEAGAVVGAVQVLSDLTEQKRAEAAERDARARAEEVERLQRELAAHERLLERLSGP